LAIPLIIILVFANLIFVIPTYFLLLLSQLILEKVYSVLLKLKKANEKIRIEIDRLYEEIVKTFKK